MMIPYHPPENVENYNYFKDEFSRIGTTGYVAIFNAIATWPQWIEHKVPTEWSQEYMHCGLLFHDPVIRWGASFDGEIRWSDIQFNDPLKVMKRAKKHGMVFGASFSRSVNGRKSMLSVSRSDREVSDGEIEHLAITFDKLTSIVDGNLGLSSKEIQALRCLSDGLDNTQSAERCDIKIDAFKNRIKTAKKKLRTLTTVQAVSKASAHGLFKADP